LLTQLIANNELDDHSRYLLTASILHGIPKPGRPNELRPLAIGELFLKIAAKYCLNLDKHELPGIFEPVQLATSPAGPERAMQTIQAHIEAHPEEHITLHIDCTNAYNSLERAAMLTSVFSDSRLAHTWKVFAFSYSSSSKLLLRDHGHIIDTVLSERGVKQGCVLGPLGFAHTVLPSYKAALADQAQVTARAIMDDLSISGPPRGVFAAFDSFRTSAAALGIVMNLSKTHVQQATGEPSDFTVRSAARRGIAIVRGNHKYLGGYVGVDDDAAATWLQSKLEEHSSILDAIRDSRFPLQLAMKLAQINHLPTPIYLLRSLPIRVSLPQMKSFDLSLRGALSARLELPDPIPPSALISLTQPGGNGGCGLRPLEYVAPAAKWAAAAVVAPDIEALVSDSGLRGSTLPCVGDRNLAYNLLVRAGIEIAQPTQDLSPAEEDGEDDPLKHFKTLPSDPSAISTYYGGLQKLSGLQRVLSLTLLNSRLARFLSSCSAMDVTRLASCKNRTTARWMQPNLLSSLSDKQYRTAFRLRCGLSPSPLPVRATCATAKLMTIGIACIVRKFDAFPLLPGTTMSPTC
jgi:hypothetical protein